MTQQPKNKKPLIVKDKKPSFWKTFPRMRRMIKSYMDKEYNAFPMATTLGVAIFLLYLLLPTDIIPDFIPFIGVIDDGSIFMFLMMLAQMDLDKFDNWNNSRKEGNNEEQVEDINQEINEDDTEIIEEDFDDSDVIDVEILNEKEVGKNQKQTG